MAQARIEKISTDLIKELEFLTSNGLKKLLYVNLQTFENIIRNQLELLKESGEISPEEIKEIWTKARDWASEKNQDISRKLPLPPSSPPPEDPVPDKFEFRHNLEYSSFTPSFAMDICRNYFRELAPEYNILEDQSDESLDKLFDDLSKIKKNVDENKITLGDDDSPGHMTQLEYEQYVSMLNKISAIRQSRLESSPAADTPKKHSVSELVGASWAEIDINQTNQMKEFTQKIQPKIMALSIDVKNKKLILEAVVDLKANLMALESKTPLTDQEQEVIEKGKNVLQKFEDCLDDPETQKALQKPEMCQAFTEMLWNSAILAKNPEKPHEKNMTALHKASMAAEKSFTPKWDLFLKAIKWFAIAVAVVAITAAVIYFTGGLGFAFLAPVVHAIGTAAATTAAAGATATATVAGAGVTAAGAVAGTGATAAGVITGVVAAHPIAAGIGISAAVGGVVIAKTREKAPKEDRVETTAKIETFKQAVDEHKNLGKEKQDSDESTPSSFPSMRGS